MSSWKITYDWFRPVQENLREALCTLGNGYFATRGAATESLASRIHYPGTYIAGVYNKLPTHIAGRTVFNEDVVNCPNWLFLTFRMGRGEWIDPLTSKVLSYHQELDIRRGVFTRKISFRDSEGHKVTIKEQRIVHMADPHRAAIKYTIIPENYEGWIVVRSALDGTVKNSGVARYRRLNANHLNPSSLGSFDKNGIYLSMKTTQSEIEISEAARVRIFTGGKEIKAVNRILKKEKKFICQEFELFVHKRQHYDIEKIVSIYTSRDKNIKGPLAFAMASLKTSPGFDTLLASHEQAWDDLWKKFDIEIEGDSFSQKVLRLHTFHLLQTASVHNRMIDAGLPARGLHGEAYRGHIFWDELFAMSFFNLRAPEVSRALLLYRYRRLSRARKYAKKSGYKGAMFPWQSGSTGEEETQTIHLNPISGKWGPDYSHNQRHVSFAIAYNVWQYWRDTGDIDFLTDYGAEIILSIAQFGASLAEYDRNDNKYHTEGIMGPDEFHERFPGAADSGFKDNAYTNLLIVWTLLKAREILTILPHFHKTYLIKKLHLDKKELFRWKEITHRMNIIFNDDGIISQFDGYFSLQELDWEAYRAKYGNIRRMDRILKAEGKSPNEYKVAKQADTLMIFYLLSLYEVRDLLNRLGYRFDKDMLNKNYEYYIDRTSHGSTLSEVVHCYIARLLGRAIESWQWFSGILKSDIYDTQVGTTPEGIHVGIMGGSLDIVMRAFAGVNIFDDKIRINPRLPRHWRSIRLNFWYKGNCISLNVTKHEITILIQGPKSKPFAVPIEVYGRAHYLLFAKEYNISLQKRQ